MSISKFFLYQTLCVFLRMKDTKHIRRDFYSVTWVIPLGCEFERWGVRSKGQISVNFGYHVNFKVLLYQTLCVFPRMKDTKHIRRDFYSVTWVIPQGCEFERWGVPSGSKKFKHGHVAYQIDRNDKQNRMQVKKFILGSNWWPWGEV